MYLKKSSVNVNFVRTGHWEPQESSPWCLFIQPQNTKPESTSPLCPCVIYHLLNDFTTGFYMAKLDEIGYQVCFSSWRDVYETIQDPEFQNPAIGGIWENCICLFSLMHCWKIWGLPPVFGRLQKMPQCPNFASKSQIYDSTFRWCWKGEAQSSHCQWHWLSVIAVPYLDLHNVSCACLWYSLVLSYLLTVRYILKWEMSQ